MEGGRPWKTQRTFDGKEHPVQSLGAGGADLESRKEVTLAELKLRSRYV